MSGELGVNICPGEEALDFIAQTSSGDVRKSLNTLELCVMAAQIGADKTIPITVEFVEQCTSKKAFRHDKDGDSHYDVISAFQKSIRGSDPDAAVHYLARLIAGGDLMIICRRLMVIAAEDVGLAYPQAIAITKACVDCALQLGLPEARIPLCEAVLLLATAPKTNTAIMSIDAALHDINTMDTGDVPKHLKDAHYGGAKKLGRGLTYQYPHDFPNNYVAQEYLPENIRRKKYYHPGSNKNEQLIQKYWEQLKGKKGDS